MVSKQRNNIVRMVITILIALFFIVGFIGYRSNAKAKKIITIGEGNTTEQKILGELLGVLIENKTDIKVKRKMNLQGLNVSFMALKNGEIDGYVDNTKNIYGNVMKEQITNDEYGIYSQAKKYLNSKFNLKVLRPIGEMTPYILATTENISNKYNINTMEDTAKVSDKLRLGCTENFRKSKEGYKGLKKAYSFKFKEVESIKNENIYNSLKNNKVDIICMKYDDGRAIENSLKVLEDNKQYFEKYLLIPIFKNETLKENPKLEYTINRLTSALTSEDMRELVCRVNILKQSPQQAAKIFLEDNDFIEKQ